MKIMFASDIHGSAYYCRRMLEVYEASGASRLVILGDILYHGPRNDLPREYAPKEVIAMLNPLKNQIYAVRGNCDTEVDQMVLEFPILADYALLSIEGKTFYATHGHVYNQDHLPPMQEGDIPSSEGGAGRDGELRADHRVKSWLCVHSQGRKSQYIRHAGGWSVFHYYPGRGCGKEDGSVIRRARPSEQSV